MKALPYIAVAVLLVLALVAVVWGARVATLARRAARLERARKTVPWSAYRNLTADGGWEFGVERVWREHVFERVEVMTLAGDASNDDVLEAETRVSMKAAQANQSTSFR